MRRSTSGCARVPRFDQTFASLHADWCANLAVPLVAMTKILLTTTSFQDTPGEHHKLLADTGWEIIRARGPLNEADTLALVGDIDAAGEPRAPSLLLADCTWLARRWAMSSHLVTCTLRHGSSSVPAISRPAWDGQ